MRKKWIYPKNMVMKKAILFIALFIMMVLSWYQQSLLFADDQVLSTTHQKLLNGKLRQEIKKLRIENKNNSSFWGQLPAYATSITALVAIIGVIVTIYKLINERSLDRKQRETESLRRIDDKFTSIVTNLGSKSAAIQASAAVSILSFLKPEYREFHNQVFMILLANLKVEHSEAIYNLLVEGFEKALRLQLPSLKLQDKTYELDLSRAYLNHVNLSECDLSYADLGFTNLKYANLSGSKTSLCRARGIEANMEKARLSDANMMEARFTKANFLYAHFHRTNLVSTVLKEADMSYAQFYQASMQSAHLEGAILFDTKFEQANINDTFFKGVKLNDVTLKSILNTKDKSWKKAHFDEDIMNKLEEMDK